jgi:DNA helicase II / ATP-dependent DNA helicase PcrA
LGSSVARPQFSGDYGGLYATPYPKANRFGRKDDDAEDRHWSYEDEDQSGSRSAPSSQGRPKFAGKTGGGSGSSGSIDNIASFFAARGQKVSRPKVEAEEPTGKTGLKQGTRVRHPKYGEGTVFRREGDGDDAKITVQFQQHGVKKLVEKFAQLERL